MPELCQRRVNAADRVLGVLAQAVGEVGGDPVPLSGQRLRAAGLTPGAAGRAGQELRRFADLGVLTRYRGRGSRPDLWTFAPGVADRWRVAWRYSGREVELAIRACICRAPFAFAARVPGQDGALSRETPKFDLGRDAHLDFCTEFRATTADGRAANAKRPGLLPPFRAATADEGPPLYLSPVGRNDDFVVVQGLPDDPDEAPDDDDEALCILRAAVEATGDRAPVFGAPLEDLRRVARDAGPLARQLAAEVTVSCATLRDRAAVVRQAAALLPVLRHGAAQAAAQAAEAAARRRRMLEALEAADELAEGDPMWRELADLREKGPAAVVPEFRSAAFA